FVDLDPAALSALVLGLLIGTPAMSLIGAIAGAVGPGARRPGVLLTLLVLPLYLPPLIFGSAAVEASLSAEGARAHLLLLAALTMAAPPLRPPPPPAGRGVGRARSGGRGGGRGGGGADALQRATSEHYLIANAQHPR